MTQPDENELTSEERALLARAHAAVNPPSELEERTVEALRRRGALGSPALRGASWRYAAAMQRVAAAVLLFAAGIVVGRSELLWGERNRVQPGAVAAEPSTERSDSVLTIEASAGPNVRRVVWF
jgi:hypothetical protein